MAADLQALSPLTGLRPAKSVKKALKTARAGEEIQHMS